MPVRKIHHTRGKKILLVMLIPAMIFLASSCRKSEAWDEEINEWLSGGSQTIFDTGAGAFSTIFPDISARNHEVHEIGDLAFEQTFVSSGNQNPGLGPVYNSVSCTSCHINDGRGTPIGPGPNIVSLLMRISMPGMDENGGPLAVAGFGTQLQHNTIAGSMAEASVNITYTEETFQYADGGLYHLRTPAYHISSPYLDLPAGILYSPRIAPPVFGLGLLEAISENEILVYADENDTDGNGISGRANYVWDHTSQVQRLGRFGWKCGAPSLLQQTAGAYSEDMGITNFVFPFESSLGQSQNAGDNAPEPEISDSLLHAVSFYIATLGVPARRNVDEPNVIEGKKLFLDAGCAGCHRPMMRTAVNVAFPEVSNQLIFPYSDLLLHDMGEGLSDHRPDFLAEGSEWRTPPLWGIGLTEVVNGHQNFLHDGRARTLEEAIMWHGGEAAAAKNYVSQLPAEKRQALIAFLESL